MSLKIIEGHLHLRADGCWYVNEFKVNEGTLFEILKNNKWIMIHVEKNSQGTYYCIPLSPLTKGDKVRVMVDL